MRGVTFKCKWRLMGVGETWTCPPHYCEYLAHCYSAVLVIIRPLRKEKPGCNIDVGPRSNSVVTG